MKTTKIAIALVVSCCVIFTKAFYLPSTGTSPRQSPLTSLYGFRPDWMRKAAGVKPTTEETRRIAESLKRREESLHLVGQKFVCRNHDQEEGLPVFLFIPKSDCDAEDESNIVHRLEEGEEVIVEGQRKGAWIDHDGGGWSCMVVDGMTRLEAVE